MIKQSQNPMANREIQYCEQNYSLSYEIFNQKKDKTILFLHGWGSNKEIMKEAFFKDLNDFRQIYLDLPGFGSSSLNGVIDTNDYADIVKEFLNSLHVSANTIVGHSFGGKVATLLNPENLVLLSSAGIVVPKSLKVKTKIKLFKLFKNIVPKNMYKFFISDDVKGMSKVMYEVLKKVVDEDFSSVFKKTTSNTLVFWGKSDTATPLSSGVKISNFIEKSEFFPLEGDHFFFIKNSKFIKMKINEYL